MVLYTIREFIRKRLPILTMSPDCYQRYKFVSRLLTEEGCETILDVGGSKERFFKRFLPNKKSLTLDKEGGDIIGDGTKIPFSKKSFDAVTSLETLQYVKKSDRDKFIKELIRVAKRCVIITMPIDGPAVRSAELECNNLYKTFFGRGNRWLEEHIKSGLPTVEDVSILNGYNVEKYSICNLKRWKSMFKLGLVMQKFHLSIFLPIVNLFYITLYGFDKQEPTYIKVFFIKGVGK